jgi:hypothetical protein
MEFNASGSFFRLTILGYQYPDAEGEPYDANWLLMRVDAVGPQGAWSVADPCLLTHEVTRLADWFDAITSSGEHAPAISFLEPALLVRIIEREGKEKFLRIHFGSLVHPDWAEEMPLADTTGVQGNPRERWLDFPLADLDLPAASRSLRQQLKRYPRRKEL